MKHVEITNLEPSTKLESVYLIRDVMKRNKKNGEPYVALNLQDATGILNAFMWENADLFLNNNVVAGDFVYVRGMLNLYNGKLQLTIRDAERIDPELVPKDKFLPRSPRPAGEMEAELLAFLEQVQDKHLRALLDSFFGDTAFLRAFLEAPSARTMHQAYIGGLVEHTIGVVKNALAIAANYGRINTDLLLAGALIHDVAKVFEYSCSSSITITDSGRLIGHLSMAAMEVDRRARQIEGFPEETRLLLIHMILSHHGKLEFGSPKVPMTAEALILTWADYADAYLSTFFEKQKEAHDKGEKWTDWVDMFGHYLYAGDPPPEVEPGREG